MGYFFLWALKLTKMLFHWPNRKTIQNFICTNIYIRIFFKILRRMFIFRPFPLELTLVWIHFASLECSKNDWKTAKGVSGATTRLFILLKF